MTTTPRNSGVVVMIFEIDGSRTIDDHYLHDHYLKIANRALSLSARNSWLDFLGEVVVIVVGSGRPQGIAAPPSEGEPLSCFLLCYGRLRWSVGVPDKVGRTRGPPFGSVSEGCVVLCSPL